MGACIGDVVVVVVAAVLVGLDVPDVEVACRELSVDVDSDESFPALGLPQAANTAAPVNKAARMAAQPGWRPGRGNGAPREPELWRFSTMPYLAPVPHADGAPSLARARRSDAPSMPLRRLPPLFPSCP
jgi:hypothetical protein